MVRVWVDGCFDMMHFGHANALRQARKCGDYLVVGVHSDEDISKYKGPPVMDEKTRYEMVRACVWVDEVMEAAPYMTSLEVMDRYGCEICVHGDDLVLDSYGRDSYEKVKEAGRFREIPRTTGISTTDILNRVLNANSNPISPFSRGFEKFCFSSDLLTEFLNGRGARKPDDRVVYVGGAFDPFHYGHVKLFQIVKQQLGDYLVVGMWDEADVSAQKRRLSITSFLERLFSILSCKYVDQVIFNAPPAITHNFIKNHGIVLVVSGDNVTPESQDLYSVPRSLGILKIVSTGAPTTSHIISRLQSQSSVYINRNLVKEKKELASLENDTF